MWEIPRDDDNIARFIFIGKFRCDMGIECIQVLPPSEALRKKKRKKKTRAEINKGVLRFSS